MTEDKDIKTLGEVKAEADPDVEVQALRRKVGNLKVEIKQMQAAYGDLRGYFRDINAAASGLIIPPQPLLYKPPKKKIVHSPCIAVLHFSDWHYGAVVDAEEVEFMNAFSPEILKGRITNLIADFLNWVNTLRTAYKIEECVILDTGDNISGDIHRGLVVTNAFPTPVQAFKCGVFKGEVISGLCSHFNKVRVEFMTPDNHGRLTAKPQSQQQGLNTHNYVVGHVAKLITSKQKNVEFNIYTSHSKAVQVSTRSYLLTHGHGIMGWAGFPYYGIERKVAREALVRLHEPEHNKFHKVVLGHFHAPLTHPWYWIGGSVSGTDAYDHQQGRRSLPIQCAWINHPKKGEFNRTEFQLWN